ncbi:MAG: S8 family serine peptidase [Anaerolineales bacterium]|nr:S8 family serine peptidase [Anaerolineales bacterium]
MHTKFILRHSINVALRLTVFATFLLSFVWVSPTRHVLADGGSFKPGEVIVKLDPLTGAEIEDINATYGTTTLKSLDMLPDIYLLELPSGRDAHIASEDMGLDTRLEFAEPNFISQAPEANPRGTSRWSGLDPAPYVSQYADSLIHLNQVSAISRGAGSVVAVLDTGVQLDHPALSSNFTLIQYDFIDGDAVPEDIFSFVDSNGNGLVDEATGHGTHVAGVIHLVAPEAQIMPLRVLDSNGDGDIFTLAEAMVFAIKNGANVINLSLGTQDKSDILKNVVREATHNGVVVVAAAGNLNSKEAQYPAADNCALSVTSVGPLGVKSDFANFDAKVDFAAPGESIYSAFPKDGYASWSGTSMATPFVAGQAALIHSLSPALNPQEIANIMGETSHSLDPLNLLYKGKLGKGLIDIDGSLELALNATFPIVNHGLIGASCIK